MDLSRLYVLAALASISGCGGERGAPPAAPPQAAHPVVPAGPSVLADAGLGPGGEADGDGIPDVRDKCPQEPEDFDGFEDEDGCPDPDNDRDGVADIDDQCPNLPETTNGVEDEDGCPEPEPSLSLRRPSPLSLGSGVVLADGAFRFTDGKPEFETGKSTLTARSLPLLGVVASFLRVEGQRLRVEVGVHSDSQGSEQANLKLTQARADHVRALIIEAGVAKERVRAVGFGESRPLAPNDSAEGRAKNRRLEIVVVE